MTIDRASFMLVPLLTVASCLFMNSQKGESYNDKVSVNQPDTPRSVFQAAVDSVGAFLEPLGTVMDSIQWYRRDSVEQEKVRLMAVSASAALQKRILEYMPTLAPRGGRNPRLDNMTRRIVEIAYAEDSLIAVRNGMKKSDTSSRGGLYDSLKLAEQRMARALKGLDTSLEKQISAEMKKMADSSKKKWVAKEAYTDLKKRGSKVVEADRQAKASVARINSVKSRLTSLKADSARLNAAVSKASSRMDALLNLDSMCGRILRVRYRGSNYRVFISDRQKHNLQIHPNETGSLVHLDDVWKQLSKSRDSTMLMACNAGMYNETGAAVGLCISKRRLVNRLNSDTAKMADNFHLYPNGVFYVDSVTGYNLVTTSRMAGLLKDVRSIIHATQSGPMLVSDGAIHPAFMRNSTNLNIRNGVGVIESSNSRRCAIVISDDRVNFHEFASFFKYVLRCGNALYLDGAISQMVGVDAKVAKSARGIGLGPILSVSAIQAQRKAKST